jgi:hypothetical protein
MNSMCAACGHIHDSSWTRAVGRFNPEVSTTYRADYPGAPELASRQEAEHDMCTRKSMSK